MRQSDSITKPFIQHTADIILKDAPLEQLAGDGLNCFHRLMDVLCKEGPGNKRDTNWWYVLDSVLRRNPDKATIKQEGAGFAIIMANSVWSPGQHGQRGPVGLLLTVPSRGWKYEIPAISLGTNVGSILTIDKFMPDLIHYAETISMLARIKLAEREALSR